VTTQGKTVFVFLVPEGRRIPDAYRFIVSAGTEPMAVGTEHHTENVSNVTAQRKSFLTRGDIPDLHGLIKASRGQAPAVRAEGQAVGASPVLVQIVN
jgi:hypothetical protein